MAHSATDPRVSFASPWRPWEPSTSKSMPWDSPQIESRELGNPGTLFFVLHRPQIRPPGARLNYSHLAVQPWPPSLGNRQSPLVSKFEQIFLVLRESLLRWVNIFVMI
jgi:hypothetical protein